jgi:Flp pilus assembly protein TadG
MRAIAERRGVVAVWTAVSVVTLLGFAALSVDLGYLYMIRGEIQNVADAGALAGASAYFTDTALKQDQSGLRTLVVQRSQSISLANRTENKATILDAADVLIGRHDFSNPLAPLTAAGRWNAVDTTVRRTVGSSNGPVNLFFANVFGISQKGLIATARAAVDDRFAGYRLLEDGVMLPFTIFRDTYNNMLVTGQDVYSHDGKVVLLMSDGIREIKLYPWKDDSDAGGDAPGNFGTLNIGVPNMGTVTLAEQILHGVTAEQMRSEFGVSDLMFYDVHGQPYTYTCTGNPGLSTTLRNEVEARIGDVVGYFIHQSVAQGGSNCVYVICAIRFGRIMGLHMTGALKNRSIIIQPAPYTSLSIVVDSGAPSANGYVGRAVLVQ